MANLPHPTVLILLLCLSFSCEKRFSPRRSLASEAPKSELVQRLESIFYADDFMTIPNARFDVADYGASGDGTTICTNAIQKAIDAAAEAGGGMVTFPRGTYVSGALFMKSNVELHLAEGVIIQAIQDDTHFPDKWTRIAGIEMDWPAALINVYEQKNVRISGKGIIDGNGKFWWDKFWGDPPRSGGMWVDYKTKDIRWAVDYDCKRVRPLVVYKSENVQLQDFTVKRAGFWTISLTFSNKVHVDGVKIRNNIGGFGPSSDGINTDSSADILVENCDIDCNDDNLCIKAGRDADGLRVGRPAENIVYRNCITRAGHGLFTIGSETSGGVRNVEVYGLEAVGTSTGIRFKSAKVRGGVIENLWFHDIKMTDVKKPFQFELNWYPEYSYPTIPPAFQNDDMPRHWKVMTTPVLPAEKGIPEFKAIRLSNISVRGAERGFYANAYPEKPISDLRWENIQIEAQESGLLNYAADWSMTNVRLTTAKNTPLELKHCTKVDTPAWTAATRAKQPSPTAPAHTIEQQLEALSARHLDTLSLVAYNASDNRFILANDTTIASADIQLFVLKQAKEQSMRFFEPLGDGFYFSQVRISQRNHSLSVQSQKHHHWTISQTLQAKPRKITGADEWTFDPDNMNLQIKKSGKSFQIEVAL